VIEAPATMVRLLKGGESMQVVLGTLQTLLNRDLTHTR
jgi:hypothetical protein